MRPTACTMPVNIRRLRAAAKRATMRRSSPTRSTASIAKARALRQRGQRRGALEGAARRIADDRGREVDEQLVDEARVEQRAVELRAGLDVHLVDLARRERRAAAREVDPAVAHRAARAPPRPRGHCGVALARGDDERAAAAAARARPAAYRRGGRRRRAAAGAACHGAHGELRIVLQHRADAGEDRAGARAPGVPVGARRLAGDPAALAARQARCARRGSSRAWCAPTAGRARCARGSRVELARLVPRARPSRPRCRPRAAARRLRPPTAGRIRARPPPRARRPRRSAHRRTAPCGPCDCTARASRRRWHRARRRRARARRPAPRLRRALARALVPAFADDDAVARDHAADARIGRAW